MQKKKWKTNFGELSFNYHSNIWLFKNEFREITIIAWKETEKGPLLELVSTEKKTNQQIIFEIIEKKFSNDLYCPDNLKSSSKRVLNLCITIEDCALSPSYCTLQLIKNKHFKAVHTYYGNGNFCGMKKNLFGRIKRLRTLPPKCIMYSSCRFDSIL